MSFVLRMFIRGMVIYVAGDLDTSDKHTHSSNKYLIIKHILFGAQCVDRLSKWEEDFMMISSLFRAQAYLIIK